MITKISEETPRHATHRSIRSMAAATGMSQSAVSRIWRAFALRPHQLESFKLSTAPLFIENVRDIVGLYLDRAAPILPLLPGTPARAAHDYRRHGTTNLCAALDVASGCVISDCTARHRAEEFRRFLSLIDKRVPGALDVHVIVDNSSMYTTPAINRRLLRHPRFTFHFTPTYSSWLNLVERWFAELTERHLRRGSHRSTKELVASIRTWITGWNENSRPGGALLLAAEDTPEAPARMWTADIGLSPVKMTAEFVKFGYWEPYDGPQDALLAVVGDTVFDAPDAT